jgi:hypothetical protein
VSEDLDDLTRELTELAERLRRGELGPAEAAELVESCAAAAARLGSGLDAAARSAAEDEAEGQERLL